MSKPTVGQVWLVLSSGHAVQIVEVTDHVTARTLAWKGIDGKHVKGDHFGFAFSAFRDGTMELLEDPIACDQCGEFIKPGERIETFPRGRKYVGVCSPACLAAAGIKAAPVTEPAIQGDLFSNTGE